MAGILGEDCAEGEGKSSSEVSNELGSFPSDVSAEWRSSEQVENGTPSTSPPFWDDDDDDIGGTKPLELFGKFTWKIENFSQVNKREVRSNAFEVGGYKWYILIYPQGCDVSNHLSLFLCVANHDKLLPGWSHFAQFTIAVVNQESKKSKYSDTLHRFWKKEHDWGWKKFLELSKLTDGYIFDEALMIKAQVQVIREKADRPFRSLDCLYRRELVRVYLASLDQIFRRFIDEKRGKINKFIEDKVRWPSFCSFWSGLDQNVKWHKSRDKTEVILKIVVKNFFIEKEVSSTLVMDSLYSGLKALEFQSKNKMEGTKPADIEEFPTPMVLIEKDMFVLADDIVRLLERVRTESLSHMFLPPKDDKGSQNRSKDDSSGEELNGVNERNERLLTELGRRTVEIYVLAHIFCNRIEVAYQEAVAFKRQEELIREEEAAWQAENELKARRAAEKEKRSKKKQAKHKKSTRRGKDKGRDDKSVVLSRDKLVHEEIPSCQRFPEEFSTKQGTEILENTDKIECVSDESDVVDDMAEPHLPELYGRDTNIFYSDTDASEVHPNMEINGCETRNGQINKRSPFAVDDSSSTCSTDSVPSISMSGPHQATCKESQSPNRGKGHKSKDMLDRTSDIRVLSDIAVDSECNCDSTAHGSHSLTNRLDRNEKHAIQETNATFQKGALADVIDAVEIPSGMKTGEGLSSSSPGKNCAQSQHSQKPSEVSGANREESVYSGDSPISVTPHQSEMPTPMLVKLQVPPVPKTEAPKLASPSKSATTHQANSVSRPSSAPLNPGSNPSAPACSKVGVAPLLSRSVSAAGRLSTDPSTSAPPIPFPVSYRNAIMGKTSSGPILTGLSHPVLPQTQSTAGKDKFFTRPGFAGSVKLETSCGAHPLKEDSCRELGSSSKGGMDPDLCNIATNLDADVNDPRKKHCVSMASRLASCQAPGMVHDEFPHLDIINDLLDDDQFMGEAANGHRNRHLGFSRWYLDNTMDAGLPSSSGVFDPPHHLLDLYYEESLLRSHVSSSGPRDSAHHWQAIDHLAFSNGHPDGLIPNHWLNGRAGASMRLMGDSETNGYSYPVVDYMGPVRGFGNRYAMYRPSNGL